MKALQLNETKELSILDVDKPEASKGNVVVKIHAAALNHRELWIAKGLYPGMTLPCILGADGAGTVESIGEDVDHELIGKEVIVYPAYDWGSDRNIPLKKFRVLGMPDPGTIAEYIEVPSHMVFEKPAYLSWAEAAAIPVASLTAWRAMTVLGGMTKNTKILITGIGGGVAQAGLGFANALGATAYVTSGSPAKIEAAIKDGAAGGVNYKDDDWNLQLKEMSNGIDLVLDSSPSPKLDDYFKFLNMGAKIVAYGSTGSRTTTVNISKMFLRHIQFIGTAMGSPWDFAEMLAFMAEHNVRPKIYATYPLDQAIDAMEALSTGRQTGKIVVEVIKTPSVNR